MSEEKKTNTTQKPEMKWLSYGEQPPELYDSTASAASQHFDGHAPMHGEIIRIESRAPELATKRTLAFIELESIIPKHLKVLSALLDHTHENVAPGDKDWTRYVNNYYSAKRLEKETEQVLLDIRAAIDNALATQKNNEPRVDMD